MNSKKSHRKLSPIEYMHILEVEWWIHNFRRKITNVPTDRRYYAKVSSLKKERLIDIGSRNTLPTIFDTPELMKKLTKQFIPENGGGCPVFEGLTDEDVRNYYSIGSDVRCFYGFTENKKEIIKIGKIEMFSLGESKITVSFPNENSQEVLKLSQVSRIF